jgi:hypothetical protein
MSRNDMYADWAAAYVAAPTTYKLAPLNSGTNKIDATYLPTSSDTPKGEWNANTNSPSLADGSGTAGDYYDVTTAGTQDLGSGSIAYTVGDVVKYNGSTWYKIDSVANILDGSATAADGRSTLSVNSIDEDAQANALKTTAPALYFDGSSSVVTVAHDAKQHFNNGTDDLPFSVSFWVNTDFAVAGGLVAKYQSGAKEFVAWVTGSGLRLNLSDGTDEPYIQTASLTAYSNKWTHITITSEGAGPNYSNDFPAAIDSLKVYVNGDDITSGATKQNEAAYGGLNNSSAAMTLMSFSGGNFKKGSIRGLKIFNRELTASEIAELARGNDLGFADEWGGALGGVYTQDTTPSGEWTGTNLVDSDEAGPIGGRSNILKLTTNSGSSTHYIQDAKISTGKRYRVEGFYYIPSGQSNVDGFRIGTNTSTDLGVSVPTATLGAWTKVSCEFISNSANIRITLSDGGAQTFDDAGGDDVAYFDALTITEIGTLADFRAERYDTSTSKLYDLSDNAFVGTGTSVTLTGREVPVYTTGTWTPSISFGGGSTGITYSAQEGVYTRIGNTCFVTGVITLSAVGSDTGTARLAGLPFANHNMTATSYGSSSVVAFDMTGLTSAVNLLNEDNQPNAILYGSGATGATAVTHANFTATSSLRFSMTYQIQ